MQFGHFLGEFVSMQINSIKQELYNVLERVDFTLKDKYKIKCEINFDYMNYSRRHQ